MVKMYKMKKLFIIVAVLLIIGCTKENIGCDITSHLVNSQPFMVECSGIKSVNIYSDNGTLIFTDSNYQNNWNASNESGVNFYYEVTVNGLIQKGHIIVIH